MKKKYKVTIWLVSAFAVIACALFIVKSCNTPYEVTYTVKIINKSESENNLFLYVNREDPIVLRWDSSKQDPFKLNKYYSITVDQFPSGRSNLISYEEIDNVTD